MRVAILRCQNLPSFVTWDIPNVDDLFLDDRLLIQEFTRRGIEASSIVWRDQDIDWNHFDFALIRSTWDYIDDREHFLSVLSEIESSRCRLFNPLKAVRWNSDKRYLLDLQSWRIPTVPTYKASLMDRDSWRDMAINGHWQEAILKPAIGTGGADIHRVAPEEIVNTLDRLAAEHPQRDFLVQPFMESVIQEGEWSFIYIGGELSHVLLKKPAPGDYRAHGIYGGTIEFVEPLSEDVFQAKTILARLPFDLLYARLDLVRVGGRLSVMELEFIEPILYFNIAPTGVRQLVDASLARIAK